MNRRQFLIGMSGAGFTMVPAYVLLSSFSTLKNTKFSEKKSTTSQPHAALLKTLVEHLLPSEPEAPGAREINATKYIQFVLEDPKLNLAYRQFLLGGIKNLEHISFAQNRKHFFELSSDEREKVLRDLEATKSNYSWLKEILELLMEALLSDPIYGGNSGEVGWKWLHHRPGFPRPSKNKRYFLL